MASSHSQTRPRSDVGPELRALRGVLKRAEREFAVECGVLPTELAAFEAGEQPLSPTLAAGLRRALAAVPAAWQHAFPTLRRSTDPPEAPRNEVLISRTASGVDADGRPQYVEVYEVIDCPDARTYVREHSVTEVMQRHHDNSDNTPRIDFRGGPPTESDPLDTGRPLTGRALRLLRERRRLSELAIAQIVDATVSHVALVEAHLAPVPRDWAERLNSALGTAFGFPSPPVPLRHEP